MAQVATAAAAGRRGTHTLSNSVRGVHAACTWFLPHSKHVAAICSIRGHRVRFGHLSYPMTLTMTRLYVFMIFFFAATIIIHIVSKQSRNGQNHRKKKQLHSTTTTSTTKTFINYIIHSNLPMKKKIKDNRDARDGNFVEETYCYCGRCGTMRPYHCDVDHLRVNFKRKSVGPRSFLVVTMTWGFNIRAMRLWLKCRLDCNDLIILFTKVRSAIQLKVLIFLCKIFVITNGASATKTVWIAVPCAERTRAHN